MASLPPQLSVSDFEYYRYNPIIMPGFNYFRGVASENKHYPRSKSGGSKMKKKTFLLLPFLSAILLFASISWGEDYISKNFPPDEVLRKTLLAHWKKNNIKFSIDKFLGKSQLTEWNYVVYFLFTDPNIKQQKLDSFVVIKLETNYWLMQRGDLIILIEK